MKIYAIYELRCGEEEYYCATASKELAEAFVNRWDGSKDPYNGRTTHWIYDEEELVDDYTIVENGPWKTSH